MKLPTLSYAYFVAVILVALSAGCSFERDSDDIETYFSRGPMVGNSSDAGLYKHSQSRGEWDYVATFHGMADDLDLCEDVVTSLSAMFPNERYTCRLLIE